jgi:ATPase subunit of ABC transporter with duplicated ATPase domains
MMAGDVIREQQRVNQIVGTPQLNEEILVTQHVSKRFGANKVVMNVSLAMSSCNNLALIGNNSFDDHYTICT